MKRVALLLISLLLFPLIASASFHKHLWPQWEVNNPLSKTLISHEEWQTFLTRCVITNEEGIHLVDYPHLSKSDIALLKQYTQRLSLIPISTYSRNEQLAFWINLYNALVVQIVADNYPIETVQDVNISPGLFSVGPWGSNLITVANTQLSLDDIQNRIIRPLWNDPRTHYALNDGTLGAANLSKQAFQGDQIEAQLNQAAFHYINSLRGVQVIDGKLIASKLYDWYLDDFGGTEAYLITHLSIYAKEILRQRLKTVKTVDTYMYNWHLNSTIPSTT